MTLEVTCEPQWFGDAGQRIDYLISKWAEDLSQRQYYTRALLTGPSGLGKTLLIQSACRLHSVPLIILDPAKLFVRGGQRTIASLVNDICIEASIRRAVLLIERCHELISKKDGELGIGDEQFLYGIQTWMQKTRFLLIATSSLESNQLHAVWCSIPLKFSLFNLEFDASTRLNFLKSFQKTNAGVLEEAALHSRGFLVCDLYDLALELAGNPSNEAFGICCRLRKRLFSLAGNVRLIEQRLIPSVDWKDIYGQARAKETLCNLLTALNYKAIRENYTKRGICLPKGIILQGPPGTGKTLLARAIATHCNAHFQSISADQIIHAEVGASEISLRKIFREASRLQPSVLFVDELDTLTRGAAGSVPERVSFQLAEEFDNLDDNDKILVIGATNFVKAIPQHLLQFRRFALNILVGPLSLEEQSHMLASELAKKFTCIPESESLKSTLTKLPPMTGAEVCALLDEIISLLSTKAKVTSKEIVDTLQRIIAIF